LQHAVDLVESAAQFMKTINEFLEAEAAAQPKRAKSIRRLKLAEVCLFWPKRPDDGMLYFATEEADDQEVWRSDYVARMPSGLGCDT
jgi:hypothetical protein